MGGSFVYPSVLLPAGLLGGGPLPPPQGPAHPQGGAFNYALHEVGPAQPQGGAFSYALHLYEVGPAHPQGGAFS